MSLRDRIIESDDRGFEDVDVPEWDCKVRVRGLTGTDRDRYEAHAVQLREGGQDIELRLANFRSKLLVLCLYDPDTDERIFGDNDAKVLGSKSAKVIERLHEVAYRLSGMDDKAVVRAEGNSATGPSVSSITA